MGFGDSDIQYLLADMGVMVTLGAGSTKGLVDSADELVAEGVVTGAIGLVISVTIKTGSLSGLAVGAPITVDSSPYTVRSVMRIDDGVLTRILCGV